MIAGLALAVESANIVGYTEVSVAAGNFCMIGAQFTGVGQSTIAMGDLIQGDFAAALYKNRASQAPQVQILDASGSGYATYYYLSDAYDEDADDDVEGWANASGDLVTAVTLKPGDSVWFKAIANTTLQLKGEVIAEASTGANKVLTITTTTANQFSMIANPFPTVLDINAVTWTGLPQVLYKNRATQAAQIQVLDASGSGYATYYYLTDAYDEDTDDDVEGWANASGDLTSTSIGQGLGFWLKLPSASTVTASFSL